MLESPALPARIVHRADGPSWLRSTDLGAQHAVITSLPDVSELPRLDFNAWREWFVDTAALVCERVAPEAVAIFFQTDVKREGHWIDKGFLVQLGAERAQSNLLWHKVVCRAPAGTTTFGRPAYAHLLCFSKKLTLLPGQSFADVIPELGEMPWARAMGTRACTEACKFLLAHTNCRTVVDPFCGIGTVLAIANGLGMDAIGVEISAKRARRAQALTL
ncbi:MAG: SAM-dependent methyltransferase [Myxococcota bacterium]